MIAIVRYLRRSNAGLAASLWAEIERYPPAAPGVVRELLRSNSVICDPAEAEQALAWARAHPAWVADFAALVIEDPHE
jgi:hypothetical protein